MKKALMRSFKWGWRVAGLFLDKQCAFHAAGLTYYSMLALVPVLCVLLLLAKTLGADQLAKEKLHTHFEAQVSQFVTSAGLEETTPVEIEAATSVEPEGEDTTAAVAALSEAEQKRRAATREFIDQARNVEAGLLERIDQFNVGTLGWIGLLMLVWTVVGSIGMVEVSFNEIWEVKRPRVIWRRFFLYIFVAFVLPILVALAVSVPILKFAKDIIVATLGSLWLTRWVSDGTIWLLDSALVRISISLFFTMLTFAFVFKVLPNCKVRWAPALASGLVTGILYEGWMRLCAIAQIGIAKSSALYGSFAFLPIVLAWMYVSWQIVLLGCCIVRASSEGSGE